MGTTAPMERDMPQSLAVQTELMEMAHSSSTLISVSNVHLENSAMVRWKMEVVV